MSPIYVPGKVTLAKEFTWNETVWNPSMISTALWLDAADASTITESGGAVSQWNDKSGNNRNATATTGPTYSNSSFNNKPGLLFNGVDQYMVQDNESYNTSWFGVAFLKTVNNSFLFGAGDLATASVIQTIDDIRCGTPPNKLFSGFTNSAGFFVSDKNVATWNGATMSGAGTATSLMSLHIGARGGSSLYYDGVIGEIVVFDTAYTLFARQKLEGYLAHKWGLTANLPAGHPYKLVGPTP